MSFYWMLLHWVYFSWMLFSECHVCHSTECHSAECCYSECHHVAIFNFTILHMIMLNVAILHVIANVTPPPTFRVECGSSHGWKLLTSSVKRTTPSFSQQVSFFLNETDVFFFCLWITSSSPFSFFQHLFQIIGFD
jgi:hypothetical protein